MKPIANISLYRIFASLFVANLLWVTVYSTTASAEPLDGAVLYEKYQCHICHGEQGGHPVRSGYPVIAGQDRVYLIRQILDIRDGVRDNGQTGVMRPLIKLISEKEVEEIAVYLNVQGSRN